jgi:hypothetical protein
MTIYTRHTFNKNAHKENNTKGISLTFHAKLDGDG